jgi:hypothetical protein
MADRQWYTGRDGKQEGPFSDERLRELIASGMVRGDTLVWSAGMTNWAKASEVPGLMPARHVPSVAPGAAAGSGAPIGPLSLDVGVWALFWRAMILGFSELAVIPLPWIAPIFIRWFVERIHLPGGWRLGFVGNGRYLVGLHSLRAMRGGRRGLQPPAASGDSASGLFGVADRALVLHQYHLGGANGAVAIHRRLLADAGLERAAATICHHHHRLGLGRHRLDTLDVQKRAGLFARACFHRQRLGLSVARAGGGRHRHLSHSDSMDRALVHALARFANCAC